MSVPAESNANGGLGALRASARRLVRDAARTFAPRNLPWHALAMALTCAIVVSGLDGRVAATFRGTDVQSAAFVAGRVGLWTPIVAPLAILALAGVRRDDRFKADGLRLVESVIVSVVVCAAYKAFTGRPGPTQSGGADTSRVFRFGFLRGGVFWGWPSSHVMTAFAGAVTLAARRPRTPYVKWSALAYAGYMAASVSVTFHWLSDVVAGAVIGSVIGIESAKDDAA